MGPDEVRLWKDALIADRDDALIAAARRWFGQLKTPFNKHELASRVEGFLRREDTVAAIVALLDRTDRMVVALIKFAGDLPCSLVARLLEYRAGTLGSSAANRRLANMLARLILYRYRDGDGVDYYGVAPPLRQALFAELSESDLSPSATMEQTVQAPDTLAAFCGILSACGQVKVAFRSKTALSRKAAALVEACAPWTIAEGGNFTLLLSCMRGAGAFHDDEDGKPAADPRRFVELADALGNELVTALAASNPYHGVSGSGSAYHRETPIIVLRAPFRAALIREVAATIPEGLVLPRSELALLVCAVLARRVRTMNEAGDRDARNLLADGDAVLDLALWVVDTMIGLGLFTPRADGFAVAGGWQASRGELLGPSIVVEESHEIRILPEAGPAVRAFVSAVARLNGTGLVWTATLDKEAALSAFAWGFSVDDLVERLAAYSGRPLPQSVRFSLDSWAAAERSVRLRSGIVVALDDHHAAVLEHSPRARGLVRERLADGVYLLSASSLKDAEKALNGIGVRADVRGVKSMGSDFVWSAAELAVTRPASASVHAPIVISAQKTILEEGRSAIIKDLLVRLEALELGADAKAAMADRIRAGYILTPDQLSAADPTLDVYVASGLDYPGKVRMLERAIREDAGVELECLDGEERYRLSGWPRSLSKDPEGLSVLVQVTNGETRSVPVKAVSKVRLLQTDIFGE